MAVAAVPVIEAVVGETAAGTVAAEGGAMAAAGETASTSRLSQVADLAGNVDLGDGHSMTISPEQIHALLHSPQAVAAIMAKAEHVCKLANDMAVTREAEYAVVLQNRNDTKRARATVYAKNFYAVVDDAHHSTLLKAAAQTPSD